MKKRILSALLALCMALTMLPAEALAEGMDQAEPDIVQTDFQEVGVTEVGDNTLEDVVLDTGDGIPPVDPEEPYPEDPLPEPPDDRDDEIQLFANTIEHDLGNGLILTFDPSTGTITKCTNVSAEVVIPGEIEGVSVTSIGANAFYNCSNLTSVTIPDSVTSIGAAAFYNCKGINSVTIPVSASAYLTTGYGDHPPFAGCAGIEKVTLTGTGAMDGTLRDWFAPWYYGSQGGHNVTVEIMDGITYICADAFKNCTNLVSVTIPDSVTSIGSYAFYNCSKLVRADIPDSVTSIGSSAFYGCSSLEGTPYIPAGATSVEGYIYYNCSSLTGEVVIPDSVTSIGAAAFYNCKGINSVTIPVSASAYLTTGYGDHPPFAGCAGIEKVTLTGTGAMDGTLRDWFAPWYYGSQGGHNVTVEIMDGITYICADAFKNCTNLVSVTIPDSVTSIGSSAFYNCSKLTIYCYPDSYAETYAINNNIKYELLVKTSRTLTASVSDENGTSLTEGFTVTWYDKDNRSLGTTPRLSGADLGATYTFEIHLGEELAQRYQQPERQTIAPEDAATREVRLVPKEAVPTLTLTGRVVNKDGQPVEGAAVSVAAVGSDPMETLTGADGSFSLTVPCAVMQIALQKDGYYTKRQVLDLSSETGDTYAMEDCVLTEVITVSDRVTLDITQRMAVEGSEDAVETPVLSMKTLAFVLTGADGRSITDYEVQGTALLFGSGAVLPNETITISVADPAGAYVGATATVTLDNDRLGSAELVMTEKGSFRLGGVAGPEATLLVFDGSGKCVRTDTAQGGMSSRTMDAGNYRLVLLQKSDLLRGAASLDYLTRVGLTAGQDYLLREFTISNGQITAIGDCTVPSLNEGAFSYTIPENTSVTTNKSSGAAVGELILIRASYQLDASKGMTADTLRIALPDGVEHLAQYSATLNGVSTPYTYDSANHEICISVAGQDQATAYVYCAAAGVGTHNISAALTFSGGAVQPVGTAAVQVESAKLNVVERTGVANGLTASGKTLPNSTVVLYDNDKEVGRTTSNAVGSWSMKFDLVQPVYSYSYHFVRAVTENSGLFEPIATEESMITYSKDSAGQVMKITMYNTAHTASNLDPWEQETVFDFTKESTVKPYYRIWPSRYPTFTFKIEFSGDSSKLTEVYVVTTNSAGEETYVKTTYDAESNAWVGTHDYKNFNDAPVAVGAKYGEGTDYTGIPIDKQMVEDLEREFIIRNTETINNLMPLFEANLQLSDVTSTGDITTAKLTCVDATTKKTDFAVDISSEATVLDDTVTAETLHQNGYEPLDSNNLYWGKAEKNDSSLKEEFVALPTPTSTDPSAPSTPSVGTSITVSAHPAQGDFGEKVMWPETANLLISNIGKYLSFTGGFAGSATSITPKPIAASAYANFLKTVQKNPNDLAKWARASQGWYKWDFIAKNTSSMPDIAGNKALKIFGNIAPVIGTAIDAAQTAQFHKTWQGVADGNIRTWEKILDIMQNRYNKAKASGRMTSVEEEKYLNDIQKIRAKIDLYQQHANSSLWRQTKVQSSLSGISLTLSLASSVDNDAMRKAAWSVGSYDFDIIAGWISFWYNNNWGADGVITAEREEIDDDLIALNDFIKQFDDEHYGGGFTLRGGIEMDVTPINDPSGYVYEAVPSNRIECVTAIISCEAEGRAWNAADYDQINPQITSADGVYYWDVPQGNWKVNFTKDGYENSDTSNVAAAVNDWLPVPPPQLEINVGMVSTAAPTVKQATAYTDRVEVEFSQYMDINSVQSALSLTQDGTALSGCTVEPLNAEYNLENTVQYATRFAIVPSGGRLSGELTVTVDDTVRNYAGTPMAGAYTSPAMTVSARPTGIAAPDTVSVVLHEPTGITVILQPGIADRKLTVESLSPDLVAVSPAEVTTGADGSAEITLTGSLPGSGLIRISDLASGLSKTIVVKVGAIKEVPPVITVDPVTASLEDGTAVTSGMVVSSGTKILLRTQTAGAVIRYTLDDTCPCTDAALTYSAPIVITGPTVLRAAAHKDGTYSSTIRLELRLESPSVDPPTPGHTHRWATAWSSDGTHHWHECDTADCPITSNSAKNSYGEHVYDNDADTTCNTCGYVRAVTPPTPEHTHSWATVWSSNTTHHWHECSAEGCTITSNSEKDGYGAHSYDDDTDTTCNDCGYVRTVTPPTPEHTHSWAAAWSSSATHHWHNCTATGCPITSNSAKDGYGGHVYDDGTDTTCNTCGYVRTVTPPTPEHTHSWAAAWSSNATHHWHECSAEGCPITGNSGKDGYGAHVYDNDADTTCNDCGYVRAVTPPPTEQKYTIIFDANGGTVNVSSMTTGADGKLSNLPTAYRSGYTFKGWYMAAYGGVPITKDTVFARDTTIYAQWHWTGGYIPSGPSDGGSSSSDTSSPTQYTVTISDTPHGTVTASPKSVSAGTVVTVTALPDAGYALTSLRVTGRSGAELTLTDKGDGKYTFRMPSAAVEIRAVFSSVEENPAPAPTPTVLPFADVPSGSWYYDAVRYAYENGLMQGNGSASVFHPQGTATRGMIVTILYRLEGKPAAAASGFTDVTSGRWYADAVDWAAGNHIVNGYGNSMFGANNSITREQMAAILYRYAQYKGYDMTASAELTNYSDVAQVSSYAVEAMEWANASGLIRGTNAGLLSPKGSATRAEIAMILMRFCRNIAKTE